MENSIIQKIVKASGVNPGELVLVQFWGEDKDIGIMHSFATTVASLGASPIEVQQSRTVNADRFAVANENSFSEGYFRFLSSFDAVLDVFNYRPVMLDTRLSEMQMGFYQKYMASLFKALGEMKRFTQIRVPNHENATETNLLPDEYVERMVSAYDIDYQQLQHECRQHVCELSKKEILLLKSDGKYELRFIISGREWHLDCGDGDMPCGEIYIAPLETETSGLVFFDTLYAEDWGEFKNVLLTIENGVVISANNESLNKHFAELSIPDKTVCELGFGLNPNVKSLCGYTALDEKAYGTFHIAIGMNTMFGGANQSQIHMDFVGTATIE